MTNLSTSEVLERNLPKLFDGEFSDYFNMGLWQEEEYQAVLDALAQTLLKLERAKEALRFYSDPPTFDKDGERLSVPDFYDEMDFGETARAALAYIEEGKE